MVSKRVIFIKRKNWYFHYFHYFFILVGYKDFKNFSHINTFRRATLMCMLFLWVLWVYSSSINYQTHWARQPQITFKMYLALRIQYMKHKFRLCSLFFSYLLLYSTVSCALQSVCWKLIYRELISKETSRQRLRKSVPHTETVGGRMAFVLKCHTCALCSCLLNYNLCDTQIQNCTPTCSIQRAFVVSVLPTCQVSQCFFHYSATDTTWSFTLSLKLELVLTTSVNFYYFIITSQLKGLNI